MRSLSIAIAAAAAAISFATAADARPAFGAVRVGSETTSPPRDGASIIDAVAALIGFKASAKATPIAGSEAPRSAAPRTEECEEEKKRVEAAKATETRRTAAAEKRQRGGEPLYLAF